MGVKRIFPIIVLIAAASTPTNASAAGYGVCFIDKCAGAVAAVGGGCATFAGSAPLAPDFRVCAAYGAAAGGGGTWVLGSSFVDGFAEVYGTAESYDGCFDHAINILQQLTISCVAATAGMADQCVQASAFGMASNAISTVMTPMAGAEWGCETADIVEAARRTVGSVDAPADPPLGDVVEWQSLPAAIRETLVTIYQEDARIQFEAQTHGWDATEAGASLKKALWSAMDQSLREAEGRARITQA